jgi:hypothetical protein
MGGAAHLSTESHRLITPRGRSAGNAMNRGNPRSRVAVGVALPLALLSISSSIGLDISVVRGAIEAAGTLT